MLTRFSKKPVKLVVWDLDDTLWEGVLLEDPAPPLRPGVVDVLRKLDGVGVLQSIASRNDAAAAQAHMGRLGIDHFFIFPQINWGAKSKSLLALAAQLNLGTDSILFVDDQDFELAEVEHVGGNIRVLNVRDVDRLGTLIPIEGMPASPEARKRRSFYQQDAVRVQAEADFAGPAEEFLASLDLKLRVWRARDSDLARAEELTSRTSQLNTTGITYSEAQLAAYSRSADHLVLVAQLKDRFGDYGVIGLVLVETTASAMIARLFLVSCRVMSRGVGAILLGLLAERAAETDRDFQVDFRDSGRNRPMKIALMMSGFRRRVEEDGTTVYLKDKRMASSRPTHVDIQADW